MGLTTKYRTELSKPEYCRFAVGIKIEIIT